jgi:acyl carrier protein
MTRDEIQGRVRDLLASRFDIDPARVTPEARLFQDLDLDSIDAIDMAVDLQTWTGRRLSEESLKSIRTIGDVVSTIEAHLAAGDDPSGSSGPAGG